MKTENKIATVLDYHTTGGVPDLFNANLHQTTKKPLKNNTRTTSKHHQNHPKATMHSAAFRWVHRPSFSYKMRWGTSMRRRGARPRPRAIAESW